MIPILTIAIPTYNRADKLQRLLKRLEDQIALANLGNQVEILVSDNGSTDDTPKVISEFSGNNNFRLKYFRQSRNLGFDVNTRFLYERAETEYVWFFSEDDIPLAGSLSVILKGLQENNPDALIFSFMQPPGTKIKTFNFPNNYEVVTDPSIIIELLSKNLKISTYVLRKIPLNTQKLKELEPFFKNGFFFVDLAFSVMEASLHPKLCVVSQQLAACDEDYFKFRFDPKFILELHKAFCHPFVIKYLPDLAERKKDYSYCAVIQFIFAVKLGTLITSEPELCDKAIRDVRFRLFTLLRTPKTLIQLVLIKMNLTQIYKKIKPLINIFRACVGKFNNKHV